MRGDLDREDVGISMDYLSFYVSNIIYRSKSKFLNVAMTSDFCKDLTIDP